MTHKIHSNQRTIKNLQLIAHLEQQTKSHELNIYHKIDCKYCICKHSSIFSHFHDPEEDIIKSARDKINNFSMKQQQDSSLFDELPYLAIELILKQLNHFDLVNFGTAFANCEQFIYNPKLWRYPLVDFNEKLFTRKEQFNLISYLGINLRYLSLKGAQDITYKELNFLFDQAPNITHIELGEIKKFNSDICILLGNKLSKLEYINFDWNAKIFDDSCLTSLSNLDHLHSIDISHCTNLSDQVIRAFICDHINSLIHLNIDGIQDVSDETIQLICSKHHKTLKSLHVDGELNTDLAFFGLNACKNLEYFHLSFGHSLNGNLFIFLGTLSHLKLLTLRKTCDIDSSTLISFFTNATFHALKYLRLDECNIDDIVLAKISECCPLLEELYMPFCCEITDFGLDKIVQKCTQLRCLDLTGNHLVNGIIFKHVPHLYLKHIEYVNLTYCRSNMKEIFKNLIDKPNILVIDYYACPLKSSSDDS